MSELYRIRPLEWVDQGNDIWRAETPFQDFYEVAFDYWPYPFPKPKPTKWEIITGVGGKGEFETREAAQRVVEDFYRSRLSSALEPVEAEGKG